MKKVSMAQRGLAFLGLSFVGLGLLVSGMACAADAAENTTDNTVRFAQLDAAAEQILNQVTELGAEMASFEAARGQSPNTQLMVLVTVDSSPFFQLDAIELKIDENTVSFHQYTETELAALQQGGSHRLFWDNVSAGRHQLSVALKGRVPKDSDFKRESRLMIVSGTGRSVVELRVVSDEDQPFPEISLKELK